MSYFTRRTRKQRNRGRGTDVTAADKPATVSVRGSAFGDTLTSLPLLGTKFEVRRMLYYDSRFEMTQASGLLTVHYFRANDVYDPDSSGVGHQPIGFDQAMLFWEQFAVFSSKISVTFRSNTTDSMRVGVFLNPDQTNPTIQQLMENGYCKSAVVQGAASASSISGYHAVKTVNLTCDNVRYFQMKNKEAYFSNPNFIGNVASSPVELVYFGVFAFNQVNANPIDVFFDVELSYDVRFQEPRKLLPSLIKAMKQQDEKEGTDGDTYVVAPSAFPPADSRSKIEQAFDKPWVKPGGKSFPAGPKK